MNFHQRNKNFQIRSGYNKNILLPIIAVIFFITVFSLSWSRNLLFSVGSPFWYLQNSVSSFFTDNLGILNSKASLLKENSLLREQVLADSNEQVLYGILKKENDDLKNIFSRNKNNQKLILSAILVKPFLSAYDTLIIDVGVSDGVKVGDKVLADGNIYIGYISEVYDTTSKVVLYSSSGEKINVLIGDNNVEKEAIGLGGGNFKVEIPKEIGLKEGDNIVIPSISTNIFSVVEKIEAKESDSFLDILFKNPINITELKWVEVLSFNKK